MAVECYEIYAQRHYQCGVPATFTPSAPVGQTCLIAYKRRLWLIFTPDMFLVTTIATFSIWNIG